MRMVLAMAGTLLLLGCAAAEVEEARDAALVEARAAGEPVDCVETTRIRNTKVISDGVVDFHLVGGRVLRNTLPVECPGLRLEDRFSYRSTNSRLCSIDSIVVLRSGGIPGPSCSLGKFQPIELPKGSGG